MKYKFTIWTLSKLIKLYNDDKINLNPPYQRNEIWTTKQQRHLLSTIEKNMPFPNFFLYFADGKYEMVDGQQRSRAIIGFAKEKISDDKGRTFPELNPAEKRSFYRYKVAVSIITDLSVTETMEEYYVLVNSTGARLNRPELMKAEYYDNPFLCLMQKLSENTTWAELKLFTERSENRMNNVDFIGELLALIEFGPSDKKEKVDYLLKAGLKGEKINSLEKQFLSVISLFKKLNEKTPIKDTRFRQKNDFYTLFQFVNDHLDIIPSIYEEYYELLLLLAPYISPSEEECEPLFDYALNCVSQSNSKTARELRYGFLTDLFLNETETPNPTQTKILDYFKIGKKKLVKKGDYFTLNKTNIPLAN